MTKTNWKDPKSGEIISPYISGLQEAVGKIEESIGISSIAEIDIPLSEVFISNDDRCRIYQAPEGKRNWLLSPSPIIKKNGAIIINDFEIDYGGGAVVFTTPILETDILTADATYTKKIEGKGLSANDYTDEEKQKNQGNKDNIDNLAGEGRTTETVKDNADYLSTLQTEINNIKNGIGTLDSSDMQARREIMDIKLKQDEMQVVDYLNKTGIGLYDLFTDTENIDIANTTATVDTTNTDVTFIGTQLLKMLQQKFDTFHNMEVLIYDNERENLSVDTTVSTSNQIQLTISPGSVIVGDRFYYNGIAYEATGIQEA